MTARVTCGVCGKPGKRTCTTCHARDPRTWRTCSSCGANRRVAKRTSSGKPLCPLCYQRPRTPCAVCGELAAVHAYVDGDPTCDRCYRSTRRPCGACGRIRIITVRATAGKPDLCRACHWAPTARCTRCGMTALVTGVLVGEPVCFGCVAVATLAAVITRPDGTRDERLAPLLELFARVDQPRTLLIWLNRKPSKTRPTRGVDLLATIARGELDLTHDALDRLDSTPSLTHVRALLIAAQILPERDPHIAALERAINRAHARVEHADDRRALDAFARWDVLHRLRRRHAAQRPISPSAAKNATAHVNEAARFLTHLRSQGTLLRDATQAHVDRWLATGEHARRNLAPFLTWAATQHRAPQLSIPNPRRELGSHSLDHDTRWTAARRMLNDAHLHPADRVAGALVTLYAQPLTRIATLTTSHVNDDGTTLHLKLGRDGLLIPEPLASLIRSLPDRRQLGTSGHSPNDAGWLFPGRNAGHHLHTETLRHRLTKLGIHARDARTTALLQLAAELPPVVLADLLGLHRNTAVGWARAAGGDWTRYAATRATRHPR